MTRTRLLVRTLLIISPPRISLQGLVEEISHLAPRISIRAALIAVLRAGVSTTVPTIVIILSTSW